MIEQYTAITLTLLKGSLMIAGFFTTLSLCVLIVLLPFLLLAAVFTLLDDGTPPEY